MVKKIILNGKHLTIAEIERLVVDENIKIEIEKNAIQEVNAGHSFLVSQLESNLIYGVNTGFGPMGSYIIPNHEIGKLQVNLIRSHAVGMGDYIEDDYVLATMIVRLNGLVKGKSGVSVELVERLALFVNLRIYPLIPEHGAVGTSGDLVQLAHIALALIGEGKVKYLGEIRNCKELLNDLRIEPYTLKAKEGLALINGTSVMTAISALLCIRAAKLLNVELHNSALAIELSQSHKDAFSEELQSVRPHLGQSLIAKKINQIIRHSTKVVDRKITQQKSLNTSNDVKNISRPVQEVYSLRCTPQILGPIYDVLRVSWNTIEIEINSVTDNPIIDREKGLFYHGGNFHGDYIANAVDSLKIVMIKLSLLSERRVNYFLNENVNKAFPPFLNINTPGLTLALQGLQFVATSTAALNQNFGYPQYLHTIPTNGDNQDIVSMGTDASLLCAKVINNSYIVSSIESIVLAQAVDCLSKGIDGFSPISKKYYEDIRNIFAVVDEDRTMEESAKLVRFLKKMKPIDII